MISDSVERALQVALVAHAGQFRKGDPAKPYAVHPAHVALLLASHGVDEVTLVTALLHDVVEDCEGWDAGRVELEFGPAVAAAVVELTEDKTRTWSERKRAAARQIPELSETALLIKTADKLHNLSSLTLQLSTAPDRAVVWAQFSGGPERTLANSRALVDAVLARLEHPLADALGRVMDALEATARG